MAPMHHGAGEGQLTRTPTIPGVTKPITLSAELKFGIAMKG